MQIVASTIMKRKITETLLKWKSDPNRKALVVSGSRQIGKTYAIDGFAKQNYEYYYHLDFSSNPSYRRIFGGSIEADVIYDELSSEFVDFHLEKGKTLIFLDEIQNCPDARSALKPLVIDGRADIIASGSLLTVRGIRLGDIDAESVNGARPKEMVAERTDAAIGRVSSMGYEQTVRMYAFDFEEYLWAVGFDKTQTDKIRSNVKEGKPFTDHTLEILNLWFRRYMVTGGMPESVKASVLQPTDWGRVFSIQRYLRQSYAVDIAMYCPMQFRNRTEACIKALPMILGKANKRFVYSAAEKEGNVGWREYGDSLNWLDSAGIASACWNVTEPVIPLSARHNGSLKLYHFDTGLLVNAYGEDNPKSFAGRILNNDTGINQGAIAENAVANMLEKCGIGLHYFERDKIRGEGEESYRERIEIDFIAVLGTDLTAIEVKSGKNRRSGSLRKLMRDERYQTYRFGRFVKLENSNIYTDGYGIEHYPLFAAAFFDTLGDVPELPPPPETGPLEF